MCCAARSARRPTSPGVKVISDYVNNYKEGLPSEVGLLLLMDPRNGVPKAIIDDSHLTDMRTGAVTAIGAKYLAQDVVGARSRRRARHGLLECSAAQPSLRL
jgi:ornithine cyclodeaminase/alanine dehydrogenase-like protein (mu-crystallin family)